MPKVIPTLDKQRFMIFQTVKFQQYLGHYLLLHYYPITT